MARQRLAMLPSLLQCFVARNKYVKDNVSSQQNVGQVIFEKICGTEVIIYIVAAYVSFTHKTCEADRHECPVGARGQPCVAALSLTLAYCCEVRFHLLSGQQVKLAVCSRV